MKKLLSINHSYTLVELTISIALLSTVVLSSMTTFSNVVRSRDKISKENLLYNESRLVMELLTKKIKENVVDYSEYYNQNVIKGDFGSNFSAYASRFINPGENCSDLKEGTNTLTSFFDGTNDLGSCCYNPSNGKYSSYSQGKCPSSYVPSSVGKDEWTGFNPYSADERPEVSYNENYASAFCDDAKTDGSQRSCDKLSTTDLYLNSQLYLISEDGRKKTIFVKENIPNFNISSLSYIEMNGTDTDNDSLIDNWICNTNFTCTSQNANKQLIANKLDFNAGATATTIDDYYKDFVPISSFDINIVDLKFYISPNEDPQLAFAENSSKKAPIVIVITTTELSDKTGLVQPLTLTLQTTISPKYSEIESYKIE